MEIESEVEATDLWIERQAIEQGLVSGRRSIEWQARNPRERTDAFPAEHLEVLLRTEVQGPLGDPRKRWAFAVLDSDRHREARSAVTIAWRDVRHHVAAPESAELTLQELTQRALADDPRRDHWLEALARVAADARSQLLHWWEARLAFAERCSVDACDMDGAAVEASRLASEWLDRSADMHPAGVRTWGGWLDVLMARGADQGWPAHLNWRTVTDVLGSADWIGSAKLRLPEPPCVYGAASWMRAFRVFGECWADAQLASARPFLAWRDPSLLAERIRGWQLALLALSPEFMRRRQGLSRDRVRQQRRLLARSVIVEIRGLALRVLLRSELANEDRLSRVFAEHCERALGFSLPQGLSGVLPRLRVHDEQRLVAPLLAIGRERDLIERFDEDWFWNPRCSSELRETFPRGNHEPDGLLANMEGTAAYALKYLENVAC